MSLQDQKFLFQKKEIKLFSYNWKATVGNAEITGNNPVGHEIPYPEQGTENNQRISDYIKIHKIRIVLYADPTYNTANVKPALISHEFFLENKKVQFNPNQYTDTSYWPNWPSAFTIDHESQYYSILHDDLIFHNIYHPILYKEYILNFNQVIFCGDAPGNTQTRLHFWVRMGSPQNFPGDPTNFDLSYWLDMYFTDEST